MNSAKSASFHWLVGCILCAAVLAAVAFFEIQRVADGRLFALSLSWENPPNAAEVADSRASAQRYLIPALLSLVMLGVVARFAIPHWIEQRSELPKAWWTLTMIFLLSVVTDLASTIWFFHTHGINHELHPGIRLFGYAYGRTLGPMLGKTVQALCVIGISISIPRLSLPLLAACTLLYFIGTAFNLAQI